jgi:hypothetical protein
MTAGESPFKSINYASLYGLNGVTSQLSDPCASRILAILPSIHPVRWIICSFLSSNQCSSINRRPPSQAVCGMRVTCDFGLWRGEESEPYLCSCCSPSLLLMRRSADAELFNPLHLAGISSPSRLDLIPALFC